MEKKLFKWQQEALDRSATEASYGLFADPGTGKTFAALTIAKKWTNNAIVICPLSVKEQWHKEAKNVKINVAVFHYEQLRRKDSYNAIVSALKSQPTTLILDESHRIKSPSTQTTKAALKIAPLAKYKLALTGTPTANSPADLYTQLAFLRPEKKMETYRDFQSEYIESLPYNHPLMKKIGGRPFIAKKDKYGRMVLRNIDKLKARVASYGCTVKLEDVLELPERSFVQKYCEPSKDLLKTYNTLRKNFIAEFKGQEITAQNAAVLAGRLVRLTSGYGHADFVVSYPNPKLKELLTDIEHYAAVGKVIVWSVWVDERKDVIEALRKDGYNVAIEPKAFVEGDAQILVASPKMFGTGLNLQIAKYQLWLSRSWSLLEREQALARNYRAGQTQNTLVVDYLTKGTIDELVLGALETKTDLLNQIMTTGEL